jgi:hypothetical protein
VCVPAHVVSVSMVIARNCANRCFSISHSRGKGENLTAAFVSVASSSQLLLQELMSTPASIHHYHAPSPPSTLFVGIANSKSCVVLMLKTEINLSDIPPRLPTVSIPMFCYF